jgi:hypothetical protein
MSRHVSLKQVSAAGCPARLATYVDRSRRGGNPRERDLFDAVIKEMLNAYTRKQMQRIDYR